MLKNRFLLGTVAFGVSFGISLLTTRDAGKATLTGLTTVPAAIVAVIVVERRSLRQAESRINILKRQIHVLQKRRTEAHQALLELQQAEAPMPLSPNPFQPDITLLQTPVASAPTISLRAVSNKPLSWDLSAPVAPSPTLDIKPHELPTAIQSPQPADIQAKQLHHADTTLSHVVSDASAAKRKIEGQLNALQRELTQLQQQVAEHRQTRDTLTQEVTGLQQQAAQLTKHTETLRGDVAELERCRTELEQFLAYAEGKKQELEAGLHPLQIALKQLQAQVNDRQAELQQLEDQVIERRAQQQALDQQVTSHPAQNTLKQLQTQCSKLQEELFLLESQIGDRRLQKEALEQQLASLQAQQPPLQPHPLHSDPPSGDQPVEYCHGSNGNGSAVGKTTVPKNNLPQPGVSQDSTVAVVSSANSTTAESVKSPPSPLQRPKKPTGKVAAQPSESPPEKANSDLAEEWEEFMVQLPEYEFMVLKAIAEQRNAASIIKKIAEDNLTMPELLIDSINERALDIVGDIVIEPKSGSTAAAIAPDHQKTVKRLIKTYEYLTD